MLRPRCFLAALFGAVLAFAGRAPAAETGAAVQSLAGEWRFALDRADVGVTEHWFERTLPDRIQLPGILQAQGYGDEIRTDTPWVTTLGDAWWKLQPAELREKFSQPGHVEVPFLSQPPRHYVGAAWYQREFDVPASAAGRRFVLFLERAHWQSTVWVDATAYPPERSLVAPHVTDLGLLSPGHHRLTLRVDNRQIVRESGNDGHMVDSHSVSDSLGATWNGVVGRIELSSTPPVWIADVQVFPNVTQRSARVKVKIGNATHQAGAGSLALNARSVTLPPNAPEAKGAVGAARGDVTWSADGTEAEFEVALNERATTWDEFHPALLRLEVILTAAGAKDRREATFGLREVTHRDKDLLVNGRIVNLRTTHSGGDFPLTGHPAMDVEYWRQLFHVCQQFGLNGMRFHSWCPPEAAFTAADELGFYLQPELGFWAPFNPEGVYTRYLEEETPRLLQAYGNHPSFVLLSPSNEPGGRYVQVTPKWAAEWYARDPRRLYSAGTGWSAPEQVTGGAQYAALVRFGGGELRNFRGWFGQDYRAALESVHIPVLSHEVGQWCAYPDFDVVKEFTGYLRPGNYHIFQSIAEQTGLLADNHAIAWASGRFQLACYKEEIEANLRTPGLSGYQLLDLHDYLGQGTALIGLLDAFWVPKRYVTAEEFRRFNSQTVPLARLAKRTFTTDETLDAPVELYHFAAAPMTAAKPYWKIVPYFGGASAASGVFDGGEIPLGKNIPLGRISVALAKLPAPAAYKLVVGLAGTAVENDWNFWLYPAAVATAVPEDVLVTSNWADAETRLVAGGKVLFTPTARELDPNRCPPMTRLPVFWNIQMTVRPPRNPVPRFDAMLGLLCDAKHPALAGFPTDVNCDWQWTSVINGVRPVNLTGAPAGLRPIVATIDDWNRAWRLAVIFEAKVQTGRLLVCTIPGEGPEAEPAARQLRRSLLDYMHSDRFQPSTELSIDDLRKLWTRTEGPAAPHRRNFDPDLDDGSGRPAPKKH
jgi:hypothetical protein